MPTANEKIQSEIRKRQAELIQVANGIRNDMVKKIDSTNPALKALLRKKKRLVSMGKLTKTYQKELKRLEKQIRLIRNEAFKESEKYGMGAFRQLAKEEVEFVGEAIEKGVGFSFPSRSVPKESIVNLVSLGRYQGDRLKEWYSKWRVADLRRINNTVRSELAQGHTLGQMEQRLFGTKKKKYRDGIINGTRVDAERLARTCTNGIANSSRDFYYQKNEDILDGMLYDAVFDLRTSMICAERGGNVYPVNDKPELPAHVSCRTVYSPVVSGVGVLGKKPSVGEFNFRKKAKEEYVTKQRNKGVNSKEARRKWANLSSGYKSKLMNDEMKKYGDKYIGSVPAKTSYEDWLKSRTPKEQLEVLGKTRAKLFNQGKLTLSDMVNNGRTLTVDELTRRRKGK